MVSPDRPMRAQEGRSFHRHNNFDSWVGGDGGMVGVPLLVVVGVPAQSTTSSYPHNIKATSDTTLLQIFSPSFRYKP